MGDAKRRKRTRARILDGAQCIYCGKKADTIEHMPPTWLFVRRLRPSGMEFPACLSCNNGTRAADLAVGWFGRLQLRDPVDSDPMWKELKSRQKSLETLSPGLINEVFDRSRVEEKIVQYPDGIFRPVYRIEANGPILAAHMIAFGAKLGMALYYHHTGNIISNTGGVYVQPFMNGGIDPNSYRNILSIFPKYSILRQGKIHSAGQFEYNYNTDEKSIVAAIINIQNNLKFLIFAVNNTEYYDKILNGRICSCVKLGGVVDVLSSRSLKMDVRM